MANNNNPYLLDVTKDTNKLIQNLVQNSKESVLGLGRSGNSAVAGAAIGARYATNQSRDLTASRNEALRRLRAIRTGMSPSGRNISGDPDQQQALTAIQHTKLNNIAQAQQSKQSQSPSQDNSINIGAIGLGTLGVAYAAAKATMFAFGGGENRTGMSNMQAYNEMQKSNYESISSPARRAMNTAEDHPTMSAALAGAAIGGIAGSAIPVVGTAIGAGLGFLAGAAGEMVGEWVGDKISGVGKGGR